MMFKEVKNEVEMKNLGASLGHGLRGGEIIELIGDVGSGKTTFVKGIASGLDIDEYVQSPSFTINRIYSGRDGLTLAHYDFYRLDDAGIMANELSEVVGDPQTVTVIEWGGVVDGVLPKDRLTISINSNGENTRQVTFNHGGQVSQMLMERLA